ncbi:hypothetical protein FMN63_23195 [Stappia sp. BW2]|uniref:hypothetical protein n=1 Tax=Stappia sp. BW2 TaxID=2592622 RepID=UPI0011DEED52|nr:hypothetical protein [Stappia sp. BW2]TYC65326.1 hypothetical protein FMN63_23195 [Stappia sp. BW2]
MTRNNYLDLDKTVYQQVIGCSLVLVMLFGLGHNIYLSAGDPFSGPTPSTHPITALGFLILAGAIFFRPQWDNSHWLKNILCWLMIVLTGLRIVEALFPDQISVYAHGWLTDTLEAIGMYGRLSVETALFLVCCFGFELSQERHTVVRLLLVSVCLAVLSLGFAETVYAFFLWGEELSMITQIGMCLVSLDLMVRMRNQPPFKSVMQPGRSNFHLQFTALALYLLPMIVGTVVLHKFHISPSEKAPFELFFAGTSCALLAIVLLLGTYLDRKKPPENAWSSSTSGPSRSLDD